MEILLKDITLLLDPYKGTEQKQVNVVIEDDQITDINSNAKLPSPEYVVEGKALVALPPAINSHTHLPMTLLRGYSDNKVLYEWLTEPV
jgi:5-methylthioadenosine/S-adenosylhomocysteine deaminase